MFAAFCACPYAWTRSAGIGWCAFLVAGAVGFFGPARLSAKPDEAEREFDSLRDRYKAELDQFYADYENAKSEEERTQLFQQRYPANTMVDEFLRLEEHHRGSLVGISALHHLVSAAGGGGSPDAAVAQGRQKALKILAAHYSEHPDLDMFFDWLSSGARGPEDKSFLRQAAQSPHANVRGAALLALAQLYSSEAQAPVMFDANLELMRSESEKFADQIKVYTALKHRFAGVDPLASRREALRLLDEIAEKFPDESGPRPTPYGPILLKADSLPENRSAKRRPLSELAESMRYELTHLSIGQAAPEIAGPDALGHNLKLSDQRGKVVVLMFSFKGCGPCEEMYPANHRLVEIYRGRPFAFLGVMGDEKVDTVKESVDQGKITWPVWWDGGRINGTLAKQWNVRGWPEIYVLDHKGIIRFRELRGELLELAVSRLVKEAEQSR